MNVANGELRAELARRVAVDQAARRALGDDEDGSAIERIDAENTAWLRDLVSTTGWPLISQVGADGARDAWLLVQHADADPGFQRHCLGLLTTAAQDGEASPGLVAYLTDRVLLAEGQPQRYGTQFIGHQNGWRPRDLTDPDRVDERRASMGLDTIAENQERMLAEYGPPSPSRFECPDCGAPIEFWWTRDGQELACGSCTFTASIGQSTT